MRLADRKQASRPGVTTMERAFGAASDRLCPACGGLHRRNHQRKIWPIAHFPRLRLASQDGRGGEFVSECKPECAWLRIFRRRARRFSAHGTDRSGRRAEKICPGRPLPDHRHCSRQRSGMVGDGRSIGRGAGQNGESFRGARRRSIRLLCRPGCTRLRTSISALPTAAGHRAGGGKACS